MCSILNQYQSLAKNSVFCYELDPMHDQIFIELNYKYCELYIKVHTRIEHTCTNRRYIHCTSVHTAFLATEKNTHKIITELKT